MTSNNTLRDLIDVAIVLEDLNERFYLELARKFSHRSEIEVFWKRMAMEEKGHAKWLRNLLTKAAPEVLDAPCNQNIFKIAQRLRQQSISVLDNIENLEQAYQTALDFENSEINTVFEFLLSHFPGSSTASFLRRQLDSHANIGAKFPSQYQNAVIRESVHAQK